MLKLNTLLCLIAASVLAASHYLSLEFYLYWRYLWLDIPMHTLGGMVAALGLFVPYDLQLPLPERWLSFWPAMTFVLIIILSWEVYEVMIGIPIDPTYIADTLTDILVGLFGGMVGYRVGTRVYELSNLGN